MIAGFGLHGAPHMGDVGQNDPKRTSCQLLGVLGFSHLDLHVDFASSNKPLFRSGGYSDVHTLSRDVIHDMKDTVCMSDCVVTVDGLRTRNV